MTGRIGILLWLNQEFGRQVLIGAEEYVATRTELTVELLEASSGQTDRRQFSAQINRLDGLLSALPPVERQFRAPRIKVPVIECSLLPPFQGSNTAVGVEPSRIVESAVEHFQSLQLRSLAYYDRGLTYPAVGQLLRRKTLAESLTFVELGQPFDAPSLRRAVGEKPLPIGILCASDRRANDLVEMAAGCGLRVPQDLVLVGIGNDPLACLICKPAISSIAVPAREIGRAAVQALESVLAGQPSRSRWLPPGRLVQRGSSRMLASDDPSVEAAVLFLRSRAGHAITVADVARHVGLTRWQLDTRMQAVLGCTTHEELTRCRIAAAKQLLATSDLPAKSVAYEVGRMSPANFTRFFLHHTGTTPTRYRQQHDRSSQGLSDG